MGLPKRHDVMLISGAKTKFLCVRAHCVFLLILGRGASSAVAVVLSYSGVAHVQR
jgi:hypothetical protein